MTFNCSVCWEPLATAVEPNGGGPVSTDIIATRCGHLYHTICLQDWLGTQDNAGCPTCRNNISLQECMKLYPSRDDVETEGRVSKMKEMKQKIEKLEVDLKKANTNAEKEKIVQKSLKVELNSKIIELDNVKEMMIEQRQKWRWEESNFSDEVAKLKEEKESMEKLFADSNVKEVRSKVYWKNLVEQRDEQCARLEKQLAASESKLMLKQEELELAKRFTDTNSDGIIQSLSRSRDLLREELRALQSKSSGAVKPATRVIATQTDCFIDLTQDEYSRQFNSATQSQVQDMTAIPFKDSGSSNQSQVSVSGSSTSSGSFLIAKPTSVPYSTRITSERLRRANRFC